MATTQLQPGAWGGRRYGSFAAKEQTNAPDVVVTTAAGGGPRLGVRGRKRVKRRLILPNGERLWVWADEIPRLLQEYSDAQEAAEKEARAQIRKAPKRRKPAPAETAPAETISTDGIVGDSVAESDAARAALSARLSTLTDAYRQYASDMAARIQILNQLAAEIARARDMEEDEDIELLMMIA